jgi:hypothetical protein
MGAVRWLEKKKEEIEIFLFCGLSPGEYRRFEEGYIEAF